MAVFAAKAGVYRTADAPDALLAERLHEVMSQEAVRWTAIHAEDKEKSAK